MTKLKQILPYELLVMTENLRCSKSSWEGGKAITRSIAVVKTNRMSQTWDKVEQQHTRRVGGCLLTRSKSKLFIKVDTTAEFALFIKSSAKRLPRAEYWYVSQCGRGIRVYKMYSLKKKKKSLWWEKAADRLRNSCLGRNFCNMFIRAFTLAFNHQKVSSIHVQKSGHETR